MSTDASSLYARTTAVVRGIMEAAYVEVDEFTEAEILVAAERLLAGNPAVSFSFRGVPADSETLMDDTSDAGLVKILSSLFDVHDYTKAELIMETGKTIEIQIMKDDRLSAIFYVEKDNIKVDGIDKFRGMELKSAEIFDPLFTILWRRGQRLNPRQRGHGYRLSVTF